MLGGRKKTDPSSNQVFDDSENRPASSRLDPIAGRHTRTEASPFFSVSNFSDSYFFPTIDLTCTNDNFETKYKASLVRNLCCPSV